MYSVHRVVACHHGTDIPLLDGLAEGGKVYFVHRTFIRIGTNAVAVILLLIERKMLYGGHHPLLLHTFDVIEGSFRGEIRVFAVILEIASTKG